ncbi:MAG: 4Fe-4S dicluster domain-containing protein [Syntrophobacteraceae bacterium]|nr:4Fe-4S dicluster domain-containing protein [Syntrophobacteraceae bacterium]
MERTNTLSIRQSRDTDFIREVEEASGQDVSKCYQCGNCMGSCAYTFAYDYPVTQIMRLVQLGQKDIVLGSSAIWLCANCQACTTRCPNDIDVARVMEALRIMSRKSDTVSLPDIQAFYDEFLRSVKTFGRVFETGLLPIYNLRAKKPFTDFDLAPRLLMKGKLTFFPALVKKRKKIAEIFEVVKRDRFSKDGKARPEPLSSKTDI